MIDTFKYFYSYMSCPSNGKIDMTNDSPNIIAGKGNITPSPTLILENISHVFKLCINLILVIYHKN